MKKPIVATWGIGPTYRNRIKHNIQKAIDAFLRKPIYNQIGKKWIQTAKMLKNANIIK
jgi:hypothetical protein